MPISFQPKSVLIAGGSLASLMHAVSLLASPSPPPKILILERAPTALLHNQGAGIVASPDVQAFFKKYFPSLNAGSSNPSGGRDIVVRSRLRHYLNREGGVVEGSVDEREQRMTSWDLLYHVLRWRVEGMESGYVGDLEKPNGEGKLEYRNGCIISDVQDAGDGKVRVTWKNGDADEESEVVDLLIGADGASSTVRKLMLPPGEVERTYAGYVAWRGTVPEQELTREARDVFLEKFTFFHADGIQTLGYVIPGHDGTVEPGKRLFNWVWYVNYEEGSADLDELMTDVHGKRHAVTLPVGGMQSEVWEKQKVYAAKVLPPQFAEAVSKTKQPFIQAITDVISPQNSFLDGKVLLVGDALAGFRPHTAASTGQAAYDALSFANLLAGEIDKDEYDGMVRDFARRIQEAGVIMGERSQFGKHPFAA